MLSPALNEAFRLPPEAMLPSPLPCEPLPPPSPLLEEGEQRPPLLDAAEREALILAHMEDVKQVARGIVRRLPASVQLEDLIQAGTLGLIDAAQRYDRNREMLFRQYARIRITGAIFDSLRELDWASRYMRTRQQKLETTSAMLETRLGRSANSEELAEAMGMDLDSFYEFATTVQELQRVEIDAEPTEEQYSVREQLAVDPENAPDAVFFQNEERDQLREAIDKLPRDERAVMFLYYYCSWTMEAIAQEIQRTESRVSQIHARAVARLRQRLKPRTVPQRTVRRPSKLVKSGPRIQ